MMLLIVKSIVSLYRLLLFVDLVFSLLKLDTSRVIQMPLHMST
jgi:hypothetical protein